jgi:hypothetical protein
LNPLWSECVSSLQQTDCWRVVSSRRHYKTGLARRKRFVPSLAEAYTIAHSKQILEAPMELHGVKANVRPWGTLIVAIACSIAFCVPVAGQTAGDPAKAQMEEMNRRELQLNSLGGDKGHSNDPKRAQAMMDQVSEDFQRILTRHNEIVRALAANRPLSYQFISDATGEIRKRSARLQYSLKLQKPEATTENRATETDFKVTETKDELILLCKQIESFVRNPIIEKPGTVDAQQLGKARKDLQSIVELSDAIKRRADKQRP